MRAACDTSHFGTLKQNAAILAEQLLFDVALSNGSFIECNEAVVVDNGDVNEDEMMRCCQCMPDSGNGRQTYRREDPYLGRGGRPRVRRKGRSKRRDGGERPLKPTGPRSRRYGGRGFEAGALPGPLQLKEKESASQRFSPMSSRGAASAYLQATDMTARAGACTHIWEYFRNEQLGAKQARICADSPSGASASGACSERIHGSVWHLAFDPADLRSDGHVLLTAL